MIKLQIWYCNLIFYVKLWCFHWRKEKNIKSIKKLLHIVIIILFYITLYSFKEQNNQNQPQQMTNKQWNEYK